MCPGREMQAGEEGAREEAKGGRGLSQEKARGGKTKQASLWHWNRLGSRNGKRFEGKLATDKKIKIIAKELCQPGMVVYTYNTSTPEAKARDHEFKANLGYMMSSRLAWHTQ